MGLLGPGIQRKTAEQVALMRRAGLVVARTLDVVRDAATPGTSTAELDALAERHIRDLGATPSFLGYQGFRGSICVSVDEEVVHGVPGPRVLAAGDLVSVDCGAIVEGWHGDAATTFAVGDVPDDVRELDRVTEAAMWAGIAALHTGERVSDVSHAVEQEVRSAGDYGVVPDYTGHGIGTEMHMAPDVPNVGRPGRGPRLRPGMVLAVEPMVTLGTDRTVVLDDDWTVVTADGSWAAHHEHTTALLPDGLWVLTAADGGRERLDALGVPYAGD